MSTVNEIIAYIRAGINKIQIPFTDKELFLKGVEELANNVDSNNSESSNNDNIPTKVSELENDANYVTATELESKGYQTEEDCAEAVATAVADLVNSAPETLDTLQELAAALGNDPNFATTITTLIGSKVDTDTYNSDKETFALKTELPTKTSDLTNDSGFITSEALDNYAKTTDIPDTSDMLTKTEAAATYQPIGNYLTSVPSEYITETELATELEDYAKSSDIPAVPTNVSAFTNDAGYITNAALSEYAKTSDIPTNVSELTNDSGYITTDALADYAKTEDIAAVTLSVATETTLGGIKIASDEIQTVDPQPVLPTDDRTYASQLNGLGQLVVNVPWTDTTYDEATTTTAGLMSAADKTKLDGISVSGIVVATELPASPDSNTLYLIVSE